MGNKTNALVNWIFDTFLTSKEEKKRDMEEKERHEEELKKTLETARRLIEKYNLSSAKWPYGSQKAVLEIKKEDFIKILSEERVTKIFNYVPRSAGDLGLYDQCPYYFFIDGVRIVTYASLAEEGFFRDVIGPLLEQSHEEVYDQAVMDYVTVINISNGKKKA